MEDVVTRIRMLHPSLSEPYAVRSVAEEIEANTPLDGLMGSVLSFARLEFGFT